MRFVFYDSSGEIKQTAHGKTAPQIAGLMSLETEGPADHLTHHVVGGALVAYSAQQMLDRETPARRRSNWSNAAMAWVDLSTLAQVKTAAWERIKAERERRLAGTFTHAGNTYDIDPVNISGATIDAREALIAGESLTPGWSQMWVLSNNTTVTLTANQMIAVGRACKAAVSNLWATSQYLRGQIEATTTITQVEAITWP